MFDFMGQTQFEVEGAAAPLTPVEYRHPFWVKRDDLWDEGGIARGGKARTAGLVARRVKAEGGRGLALALARNSSVPGMVSRVCKAAGIGLMVHIPHANSELSATFKEAQENGAAVHQHKHGYMTVLRAELRRMLNTTHRGYYEVGIGLEYAGAGAEAATAAQVANIPHEVRRVVVPVGSGGMLRGVIAGRKLHSRGFEILGVCAALPPKMEIPPFVRLVEAKRSFGVDVKAALPPEGDGVFGALYLDPTYEAKCYDFLEPGDLLWVVGHRDTE